MLNERDRAQIVENVYYFFRDAPAEVGGLPNSELVDGDIPNTALIRALAGQLIQSGNESLEDVQETVTDILQTDFGYRHISRELDIKQILQWNVYLRISKFSIKTKSGVI